jgi:hypothetical protein
LSLHDIITPLNTYRPLQFEEYLAVL